MRTVDPVSVRVSQEDKNNKGRSCEHGVREIPFVENVQANVDRSNTIKRSRPGRTSGSGARTHDYITTTERNDHLFVHTKKHLARKNNELHLTRSTSWVYSIAVVLVALFGYSRRAHDRCVVEKIHTQRHLVLTNRQNFYTV